MILCAHVCLHLVAWQANASELVSSLFDAMRNTVDSNAIAAELAEFAFDVTEVDVLFQKVRRVILPDVTKFVFSMCSSLVPFL